VHPTSLRSILMLSSHLRLGFPSILLLSVSPTKVCVHFSFLVCVLHALSIGSPLTGSP